MTNREDRTLPWDALTFVLAAGGVALFFVGIGWWLANRRQAALAGGLGGLDGATFSVPSFPPALPVQLAPLRSHDYGQSRRPDVEKRAYIERRQVGASAVEILSSSRAGARRVRIACDQPIRIANGRNVEGDPGLGMPIAATEQPFDLGVLPGDQKLFAVCAPGGSPANVTILTQLVES